MKTRLLIVLVGAWTTLVLGASSAQAQQRLRYLVYDVRLTGPAIPGVSGS